MLLSVHMTSVLFLVRFNNFALTMGFYLEYICALTLCALVGTDSLQSSRLWVLGSLGPCSSGPGSSVYSLPENIRLFSYDDF